MSSSNLLLDAYNTLMFYGRALLRIMIPSIEGKCTSSRIGLLASVQVLLEQVRELKILDDMKKCDHGVQVWLSLCTHNIDY